ncbi:MAG: lamin tail domain-containing protein [Candidatus Bipolaricaulota bacterium]
MRKFSNLSAIAILVFSIFLVSLVPGPIVFGESHTDLDVILVPVNYGSSDQVVTLLNKSGEELDLSGFRIRAGSGNAFEFPSDERTVLKPFGIIRVHSGPDAEEEYSGEKDFYWTSESIWDETNNPRLIDPEGKVISELDLSTTGEVDLLAGCLTRNQVKMYGLVTCPHCQSQKDEFGNSVRYVNYVECSENRRTCIDAGIRSVPAWVFENSNRHKVGLKSLERLSSLAGCSYSE